MTHLLTPYQGAGAASLWGLRPLLCAGGPPHQGCRSGAVCHRCDQVCPCGPVSEDSAFQPAPRLTEVGLAPGNPPPLPRDLPRDPGPGRRVGRSHSLLGPGHASGWSGPARRRHCSVQQGPTLHVSPLQGSTSLQGPTSLQASPLLAPAHRSTQAVHRSLSSVSHTNRPK